MVFKLFIFFFIFIFKLAYSNIIYDKNNITITDIELNEYIKLYKDSFNNDLEVNKAIKEIVLMKKTINYLEIYNPQFIKILNDNIKLEFGEKVFDKKILLNFLKFQKIRNEFISEYFQSSFTIKDLELIFNQFEKFKFPISKNKCLTIEGLYEINIDKELIISLFEILKENKKNFTTQINNEKYDVCVDDQSYKKIETSIINYIKDKTEENFNEFVYGKLN